VEVIVKTMEIWEKILWGPDGDIELSKILNLWNATNRKPWGATSKFPARN
jgi:hypothetical protein